MSWRRWLDTQPEHARPACEQMRQRIREHIKPGATLDAVLLQIARHIGATVAVDTGLPLDSDAAVCVQFAERTLGLLPAEARRYANLLTPIYTLKPPEATPWPEDVLDAAAPLIDTLSPSDGRRKHGLYLTPPDSAARLMQALALEPDEPVRLLDNAAGCGTLFLAVLAHRLAHGVDTSACIEELFSWRLIELHPLLAAIATLQLTRVTAHLAPPHGGRRWPISCADGLKPIADWQATHAIGNPPYMGEKAAAPLIKRSLVSHADLAGAYRGKADYSYLFVMRALLSLAPGGRLAMLTPAYWPQADSADSLRESLSEHSDHIAFAEAPQGVFSARGIDLLILAMTSQATNHKRITAQPSWNWRETAAIRPVLDALQALPGRLGAADGPLQFSAGIQSGADRLTAVRRKNWPGHSEPPPVDSGIFLLSPEQHDALWPTLSELERALFSPLLKTPTVGPFWLDRRLSGWLIYLDGSISLDDLPAFKDHLLRFKPLLEQRRECRTGRMPWWRLHWPRRRELFTSDSILLPQRAAYPRAALAWGGAYTSVDVYHAHLNGAGPLDLWGWLAWLHSLPVYAWLWHRGKRKGELLELYHRPLSEIPIPGAFAPDAPARLNQLGRQIHQRMSELSTGIDSARPWHLDWPKLIAEHHPACKLIVDLLRDVDRLVARSCGLDDDALAVIANNVPLPMR